MSLPIAWVLKDKFILLVGGGEVAETRVRKILPEQAKLVVVAPDVTSYIHDLSKSNKLTWIKREFQMSDLELQHWSFVLTAIDDHETSKAVAIRCRANHIPVNVADVIPLCDFYFGANFQQGPLKVMVSTGSGAPRLAKRVLNELSQHAAKFQFGDAITNVSKLRSILRLQLPGSDANIIQTRMLLMKTMCDKLSFQELAALKESEMNPMIRGMLLSTAACPAHPIGDVNNATDFVEDFDAMKDGGQEKPEELQLKPDQSKVTSKAISDDKDERNESSTSDESSDSDESNDSDGNSDSSGSSDSSDSVDSSDSSDNERPDHESNTAQTNGVHNANGDSRSIKKSKTKNSSEDQKNTDHTSYLGAMKRSAIECAEGFPIPKIPKFPFRKK